MKNSFMKLVLISLISLIFSSSHVYANEVDDGGDERSQQSQPSSDADSSDEEKSEDVNNDINSIYKPIQASMLKKVSQSFTDTVLELIESGEMKQYEAGQGLSPEFQNAYEARKRLNHCHKFIGPDGNPGDWGLVVEQTINRYIPIQDELLSDETALKAGMGNVCPMFKHLDQEQRREFWLWVMTSLALFESTCGFDVSNSINSNAVGIYQLHKSTVDRAPRALIANKTCGKISGAEIAKPAMNIACTLDFIRDGFSGRFDHAPPGLVTRAQQFEKLRNPNSGLIKVLKKFKLCQFDPKKQT